MKRLFFFMFLFTGFLLSGCFKDYEKRFIFDKITQLEFEDAVVNSDAGSGDYPIIGPLTPEVGAYQFRINLIGAPKDTPTVIKFLLISDISSGTEGKDYELPQGDTVIIPPGSNFGWLRVNVLPDGGGSPLLVFKLLGNKDIKGTERYSRLGLQIVFPYTAPENVEELNDLKVYKGLVIGSYNNKNIGGRMDMNTGFAYDQNGSEQNQEKIDFVLLRSSSSEMNMLTPTSTGFSGWASQKDVLDWNTRNDGSLMKLTPTPTEETMYADVTTTNDIMSIFDEQNTVIKDRPGYSTYDGPSVRIRSINIGDIILFKSLDRGLIVIMEVTDILPGAAGSITVNAKVGHYQ